MNLSKLKSLCSQAVFVLVFLFVAVTAQAQYMSEIDANSMLKSEITTMEAQAQTLDQNSPEYLEAKQKMTLYSLVSAQLETHFSVEDAIQRGVLFMAEEGIEENDYLSGALDNKSQARKDILDGLLSQ